jgi:hypothetical protein
VITKAVRRSIVIAALVTVAACTAQPKQPVDTVSAAPAAPSSAVPAPAVQSSAPAAPAAAARDSAKPVQREIPSGYKLTKRNGQEVYCRSIVPIGSKLAEEMCFTREQLEEIQQRTQSTVGAMEQSMKVCSGDTCVNR